VIRQQTERKLMTQFRFRFSRYDSKAGLSRLSGWSSTYAENFDGAVKIANAMLNGMQGADPAREYAIAAVELDRYVPNDGEGQSFVVAIWETAEEFSARVSTKG
jgi:hypothetical protein